MLFHVSLYACHRVSMCCHACLCLSMHVCAHVHGGFTCPCIAQLSLCVLVCHVFPRVGVADVHICLYTVVCPCPSLLTPVPCAGCAFRVQLHQDIRKVAASPWEARDCCAVTLVSWTLSHPMGPAKPRGHRETRPGTASSAEGLEYNRHGLQRHSWP